MKEILLNKKELLLLAIVLILGAFLRFYNLGYSDYQGDEIKALFNVRNDKNFFEFLFDQKKGPNQFLLTSAMRGLSDNYYNHLVLRFPFALAGFFSIFVFYLITRNFFNSKVALIATVFFASNGFLVAFSRIVQYQTFVILLGLLGILMAQMFSFNKKYSYLYLGVVFLAFSILFHYDGIFFAVAFAGIVLNEIIKEFKNKRLIYQTLFSGVLGILILAAFYIPFVLNIESATLSYFQERIEGVGGDEKISSSSFNFNLYQPYFSLYIYLVLGIFGIYFIVKNYKNRNLIISGVWFIFPFIFMEGIIGSPGTHIYTYLIPAMVFLGLGFEAIEGIFKNRILVKILMSLFFIIAIHVFFQSYVLFIENSTEYPWQDKKYAYFELKALTNSDNKKYYLSVFGFPYNRNWLQIREYLKNDLGTYDTSEKNTIGNFYLPNLEFQNKGSIYVEIEKPQSFSKAKITDLKPRMVFENNNGTKSSIYFIGR